MLSAPPAAAPPPVQAAVQVGHLPLRGGEELLQLVLKGLVAGGGQRLLRPGGGPGLKTTTVSLDEFVEKVKTQIATKALEIN